MKYAIPYALAIIGAVMIITGTKLIAESLASRG